MTVTTDVIVIGGGVNGTCIAYNLAKRGVAVTLVEKDNIASGPTGRSCGIIRQHYSHPTTAGMALRALEFFENFEELVGGDCDFRQTGFLVAAGPETIDTMRANVELQRSLGINTSMISVDELRELAPGANCDGIAGAAFEPDSGYADPYGASAAFARRAEELGAEILVDTEVRELIVDHDRVRGIVVDNDRIAADAVVLATGPWSPRIAEKLGIELPITPCRVQVCLFERAEAMAHDKIFVDSPLGVYTRPEGEDLMLVGSVATDEAEAGVDDPDHYQRVADFDAVSRYSENLIRRFPEMDNGTFVNGYASLYDVTPDWQPILDRLPGIEGLYLCAGSSGHGFKLAPVVGEMMADLITGQESGDGIEFFAFERFARHQLADSGYAHKILG